MINEIWYKMPPKLLQNERFVTPNSATFRRQVSQGNAEVSILAMSTCKVAYG
jgi:hypothetical protein